MNPSISTARVPVSVQSPNGYTLWGLEEFQGGCQGLTAGLVKEMWSNAAEITADKVNDTGIVLDIGAHCGMFSFYATTVSAKVKVIAVEPDPGSFGCMVKGIYGNGLENRITPVRCAIWNDDKTVHFLSNYTGSCVMNRPISTSEFFHGLFGAEAKTLDTFLTEQGIASCDFMKMDVEGAEYLIFEAASSEAIGKINHIYIEYHSDPTDSRKGFERLVEKLSATHNVENRGDAWHSGHLHCTRK